MTHRRRYSGVLFVLLLASCASVQEQSGEQETIATDTTALPLLEAGRSSVTLEIDSPVEAISGDFSGDMDSPRSAAYSEPMFASRSAPLAAYTPENPLADSITRPEGPESGIALTYDEPALPALAVADSETASAPDAETRPAPDAVPETPTEPSPALATTERNTAVRETPRETQLVSPAADAPATPPAETDGQEIHERIDVQIAQSFTIELPGENWLFLPQHEAPVRMQSRDRIDGTTVFRFLPEADRPFTLELQQQNLASGDVRVHRVEVSPVANVSDVQVADTEDAASEAGDNELADSDVDARSEADLVAEAEVAAETEDRVLTSQEMLQAAREMRTQRRFEEAFELLERWFNLYAGSSGSDLAHFLTGMILVESETLRNVRNGMLHLAVVRDEYPRSTLFREADAEYRRLQRHFVHVR